jgi:hypothetical protein
VSLNRARPIRSQCQSCRFRSLPPSTFRGDPHAPVTLVEYGDYECGLAYPIVKAVQKYFGKRLRFVFRNFPLTQIHPNAESAAETAEFAGEHGRFWEMHDGLYENQGTLGLALYLVLAEDLGLPEKIAKMVELGIGNQAKRATLDDTMTRGCGDLQPKFYSLQLKDLGLAEAVGQISTLISNYTRNSCHSAPIIPAIMI